MKAFIFLAVVGLATAHEVFERAVCRATDSCNRELSLSPVQAKVDCASYFETHVPAATKIVSSGTSTIFKTTTKTVTLINSVTTTTTPTHFKTLTKAASTTITQTAISTILSITTLVPQRKGKRTNAPGIPDYASDCSNFSRYSSGCSCLGVTAMTRTSTIIRPLRTETSTSTTSVTRTSTKTIIIKAATSTKTVTSTSTFTAISSITSTSTSTSTTTQTATSTIAAIPTPSACNLFKLAGYYQSDGVTQGHTSYAFIDGEDRLRWASPSNDESLGDIWSFTETGYLMGSGGNVLRRDYTGAVYQTDDSRTPLVCSLSPGDDGSYSAPVYCEADGNNVMHAVIENGQAITDEAFLYLELGYTATTTAVSDSPVPTFVAKPACPSS